MCSVLLGVRYSFFVFCVCVCVCVSIGDLLVGLFAYGPRTAGFYECIWFFKMSDGGMGGWSGGQVVRWY